SRDTAPKRNAEQFSASAQFGRRIRDRHHAFTARPGLPDRRHGRFQLDLHRGWRVASPIGSRRSLPAGACGHVKNRSRLNDRMEQHFLSETTQATLLLCGPLVAAKVKDVQPLSLGEFNELLSALERESSDLTELLDSQTADKLLQKLHPQFDTDRF